MRWITSNAEETEAAGAELVAVLSAGTPAVLCGELGTGKTTMVRGACRALGVEGPVTSPTFTIGQLYEGTVEVAHLDLYRLQGLDDDHRILLDDYLTPDRYAFVEWPGESPPDLGRTALGVRLEHLGDGRRAIAVLG